MNLTLQTYMYNTYIYYFLYLCLIIFSYQSPIFQIIRKLILVIIWSFSPIPLPGWLEWERKKSVIVHCLPTW